MSSKDLRTDLTGESFSEMVGASRPDSADAEVPQVDLDSASKLDLLEFQPQTPVDDLFGNSSPLDFSGQDLQVDTLNEVQGSNSPLRSSADVPISKSDYNRALFEARLSAVGDSELKLPWEQGVWKAIFTDDDSDIFPSVVPPVPGEYLVQTPAKSSASGGASDAAETSMARSSISPELKLPFYSYAIKVLPDRDALDEAEKIWSHALHKWQQIFEVLGYPGQLGRAILQEQVKNVPSEECIALRDSLGIKSPRTAVKRAQTLQQYFSWLQTHVVEWNPWNRMHCLRYLQPVGDKKPSASKGMTLLEAFRFAKFVLGIEIPDQLIGDPQLRGRAQRLMAEKALYRPARPLKVSEVAYLENAIQGPMDPIDKYMLGAVLFAILSRSRWSDLKYIQQIWIDKMEYKGELYGFVEACTKHHKTATTLTKKQLYMPLVAPVLGVTSVDWTMHWVQACDALGVDFQVQPFGALCKAASHGGVLCKRSCISEEIGIFLNRMLKTSSENAITSHSLKHTTLAWCAVYGLDEPSRTLLGHHELQGAKAMTVYSRDLLTRPLQLYCSMLSNIRLDHFRPDVSRTSRMVDLLKIAEQDNEQGKRAPLEFVDPQHAVTAAGGEEAVEPTSPMDTPAEHKSAGPEEDEVSSEIPSTGSDSSDSSSESGNEDEGGVDQHIVGPVWRNIKSHVVHRCADLSYQTACGREVDDAHFELLRNGCSTLNARCSRCFRGEVVSDVSGLVKALDQSKSKRLKRE